MPHTPFHITRQQLRPEDLTGIRLAEEAGRFDIERTRTRGGLLGRALEIGETASQQQAAQFGAAGERATRATQEQVRTGRARTEFRREEFTKEFELAQRKQTIERDIQMDQINDFIETAREAARGQFLSNVASLGLSAIFIGFAPALGLTIGQAVGIGSSIGAAIGGVAPSGAAQGVAAVGGALVGGERARAETERLRILADRNAAITRFAGSQDPREGFVPRIGEEFRFQ